LSTGRFPDLPEQGIDPLGLDEANCVSKPVVMAVQGICYTMGLELLLGTDIRVASNDTRFGQIEVKRGLYPAAGATVRLMDEIGWGNAMRYLLTGDEISAREAWRLGLVQEVTAPEKTFESALAIAQKIAKQSPIGIQATLTSSRIARSVGNQAAIKKLLPDLIPIMKSQDFKEGIQSFLERREADFKGV